MSSYSLEFLKIQLYSYRACEPFFKSPVDIELLQSMILQKEQEEQGGSGSTGGVNSGKQYTDFLLPLPEHLQQTEVGMADPAVIAQRREQNGLNKPISQAKNTAKNQLKAKAELKNRLQARLAPSKKFKIAPRPGGFTKTDGGS